MSTSTPRAWAPKAEGVVVNAAVVEVAYTGTVDIAVVLAVDDSDADNTRVRKQQCL